jgi:hypothetical protein
MSYTPTTPSGYSLYSSCPILISNSNSMNTISNEVVTISNEPSGGTYPYYFNYSSSGMKSESDCAKQCTDDKSSPTCNAFAWDSVNKVCYTQSGTASDNGSLNINNTNTSVFCYQKK